MGMSRRLVGEATGIGKTAVGEYVRRAAVAGLSWPLPDEIDDAELERRLFPPAAAGSSAARTDPDWSHIHTQMKRRGVTLALLWQEYRGEHAQGYAYSWFCERYSDWRSDGGQAIVGNVTQASRENAAEQVAKTAPQLTHAKEAPMTILGAEANEPTAVAVPRRGVKSDGQSSA